MDAQLLFINTTGLIRAAQSEDNYLILQENDSIVGSHIFPCNKHMLVANKIHS